ncbi:VWD domain-containing protein [Rhodophyticola sp.]|uniref:VWD domain-containing protein n=1 Tax=Rhodophyticola sp. TaxID=2680032 RepID=UPI003D2BBA0F
MADLSDLFDLPGLPDLPNFGWVSGDPHLQTLDGVGYDFQAAGEFVLLQSTGADDFMLQARMVPVGTDVSVNQAIATNLDGTAVMVDANDATPLHIAGTATALTDGQSVAVGNGRRVPQWRYLCHRLSRCRWGGERWRQPGADPGAGRAAGSGCAPECRTDGHA